MRKDRSATSPPEAAGSDRRLNRSLARAPAAADRTMLEARDRERFRGMCRLWLPWVAGRRAHEFVEQPYEASQSQRQCESGMAQVVPDC